MDAMSGNKSPVLPRVRPPALRQGDTVGIVAPASNIRQDALLAGCERLQRLGYKPVYAESILEQDLYFAGSVQRRIEELHAMFQREDIHAIICARGGYGCNYLVDRLDLNIVRHHPKIFMGYSDVTSLLTLLCDEAGLMVFHGPMITKDFVEADGIDVASWEAGPGGGASWDLQDSSRKGLAAALASGRVYG